MQPGPAIKTGVRYFSGIICKSKVLMFERMLFRATRGNMFFNQATADDQILDPSSNEMVKSYFLCTLSMNFVTFYSTRGGTSKEKYSLNPVKNVLTKF